jgi:type II secretory pathway pseudopilin PulG
MNNRGMTLIESLVAAAISIAGASLCFFFIQQVKSHKSGVDHSLLVKETLADNIIEVKGAALADLPSPGQCKRRLYSDKKDFISEETVTANPCPDPTLERNQMMIAWEVAPSSVIDANFSVPSLKLPSISTSLKQVTVHSWGYEDAQKKSMTHNQIVIFKK